MSILGHPHQPIDNYGIFGQTTRYGSQQRCRQTTAVIPDTNRKVVTRPDVVHGAYRACPGYISTYFICRAAVKKH